MKKIEADSLEDALIKASNEFNCSVIDLEYEIIQNPSKGFLGFGKKSSIICVEPKIKTTKEESKKENPQHLIHKTPSSLRQEKDIAIIAKTIQQELKELLGLLPYNIHTILVKPYDENTLYIKLDGEDSALLIGKEGYRYKAISYLLFNWINHKHGLMVRLEIAEFLKNQEEMIANYLLPIIETIKLTGKAQTKPLDGVLAHIAITQLREQFPNKYIAFRLTNDGQRYIIINDFHHA
ncbi:protein jag [Helicobacter apodemus]|uniref:Protein jag n=1 Tax=Helicobacter apodemus TaxID=135569 RepID=A0A4V6I6K6_9HELI|nr:Jag N-terminal domain-containing protein [Helicobacter apodemus]MDE6959125.1 Jag N-terminal domain-containing protein [Helicobacter apodemus]TLE15744.1 protein jag [Helicobacter apodemus]